MFSDKTISYILTGLFIFSVLVGTVLLVHAVINKKNDKKAYTKDLLLVAEDYIGASAIAIFVDACFPQYINIPGIIFFILGTVSGHCIGRILDYPQNEVEK
jgi:hypothetical protein